MTWKDRLEKKETKYVKHFNLRLNSELTAWVNKLMDEFDESANTVIGAILQDAMEADNK